MFITTTSAGACTPFYSVVVRTALYEHTQHHNIALSTKAVQMKYTICCAMHERVATDKGISNRMPNDRLNNKVAMSEEFGSYLGVCHDSEGGHIVGDSGATRACPAASQSPTLYQATTFRGWALPGASSMHSIIGREKTSFEGGFERYQPCSKLNCLPPAIEKDNGQVNSDEDFEKKRQQINTGPSDQLRATQIARGYQLAPNCSIQLSAYSNGTGLSAQFSAYS
ncbi:hypothetical protein F511_31686 [Dorcoceras hygrometricum]|uniref:Uncharacterized protein n=1 Tax=Dorcoceras hygrometricum TaxID=472368 RepID=A0A2Z7BEU9_9LAMI|nr:hypothetical protein F511_31686 [Dorcoceras hygrometricum]